MTRSLPQRWWCNARWSALQETLKIFQRKCERVSHKEQFTEVSPRSGYKRIRRRNVKFLDILIHLEQSRVPLGDLQAESCNHQRHFLRSFEYKWQFDCFFVAVRIRLAEILCPSFCHCLKRVLSTGSSPLLKSLVKREAARFSSGKTAKWSGCNLYECRSITKR